MAPEDSRNWGRVRRVVDHLQSIDPLSGSGEGNLPAINLLVPSTAKDFWKVNFVLQGARQASRNPIDEVTIVVPQRDLEEAHSYSWEAGVVAEENFLDPSVLSATDRYSEIGRRGWVIQQAIKLYGSLRSTAAGVLVIDSDTILLGRRTWLTKRGTQILSFSHEYHSPYETHAAKVWGARKRHYDLSYVTHHMLMQPELVRQMFPRIESLVNWLDLGELSEHSAVADYHSYGRWVADNVPHRYRIARWKNESVLIGEGEYSSPEILLSALRELHPSLLSVSSHSYLENDPR